MLLVAACSNSTPPPASAAPAAQPKAAEQAQDAKTASPAVVGAPKAPLLEQEVAYGEAQKRNLVGFLAMPGDAAEPLPGIIVIHEWWGLNDNIKAMTRKLASEGYVALAVDLYGGAKADTPEKARPLMAAVVGDQDAARANLKQAYDYLDKYALAPKIGSVGWSLGGGWSLQTALMLPDHLRRDGDVLRADLGQPERALDASRCQCSDSSRGSTRASRSATCSSSARR